jgi:hypothetical protein
MRTHLKTSLAHRPTATILQLHSHADYPQTEALGKHLLLEDRVLEKLTLSNQETPDFYVIQCSTATFNRTHHCTVLIIPKLYILRNMLILSLHLRLQQRISVKVSDLHHSSQLAHRSRPSHAPQCSSPNITSLRVQIQKLLTTYFL